MPPLLTLQGAQSCSAVISTPYSFKRLLQTYDLYTSDFSSISGAYICCRCLNSIHEIRTHIVKARNELTRVMKIMANCRTAAAIFVFAHCCLDQQLFLTTIYTVSIALHQVVFQAPERRTIQKRDLPRNICNTPSM
jgi:hypothetical protein